MGRAGKGGRLGFATPPPPGGGALCCLYAPTNSGGGWQGLVGRPGHLPAGALGRHAARRGPPGAAACTGHAALRGRGGAVAAAARATTCRQRRPGMEEGVMDKKKSAAFWGGARRRVGAAPGGQGEEEKTGFVVLLSGSTRPQLQGGWGYAACKGAEARSKEEENQAGRHDHHPPYQGDGDNLVLWVVQVRRGQQLLERNVHLRPHKTATTSNRGRGNTSVLG